MFINRNRLFFLKENKSFYCEIFRGLDLLMIDLIKCHEPNLVNSQPSPLFTHTIL